MISRSNGQSSSSKSTNMSLRMGRTLPSPASFRAAKASLASSVTVAARSTAAVPTSPSTVSNGSSASSFSPLIVSFKVKKNKSNAITASCKIANAAGAAVEMAGINVFVMKSLSGASAISLNSRKAGSPSDRIQAAILTSDGRRPATIAFVPRSKSVLRFCNS